MSKISKIYNATLAMGTEIAVPSPEIITKLCLEKYRKLPKTGKPTKTQWTVLAGIVIHDASKDSNQVVSLGLGTKCIGSSKMCEHGLIVNDSHAEILARRGLLRYLYQQLKETNRILETTSSTTTTTITTWDAKKRIYRLKPELSFHFFSSQSPCGDACIVENNNSLVEEILPPPPSPPAKKRQKLSEEYEIFTGAKLFANKQNDDENNDDRMAQTIGALRIKPGKGDRTLSMSCSDKLSKWCYLGLQGAMLSVLLEDPIYLTSMTFCCKSNLDALQRALYERWKEHNFYYDNFKEHKPYIQICSDESLTFECTQTMIRSQPSPNGLVWCNISEQKRSLEVIVNGKRQGCTKKSLKTPECALKISKYEFLNEFIDVLQENKDILTRCELNEKNLIALKYCEAKALAKPYQHAWTLLKHNVYRLWTEKSADLLKFSLSSIVRNDFD